MNINIAQDVLKCFSEFLSDALNSNVEIINETDLPDNANFGASVKIDGKLPIIVGILADKKIFHELAEHYEHFKIDTLDEDFDAVSELLNVFTGHFIILISERLGIEEDLEPPRFGRVNKSVRVTEISVDVGKFYLYIGDEEIFKSLL